MGGSISKVFNPVIAGTGQTAGDLSKIGYSGSDLAKLDPKRAILAGLAKGGAAGMTPGTQPAAQTAGMIPPAPNATPVDPSYFSAGQQQWNQQQRPSIYG